MNEELLNNKQSSKTSQDSPAMQQEPLEIPWYYQLVRIIVGLACVLWLIILITMIDVKDQGMSGMKVICVLGSLTIFTEQMVALQVWRKQEDPCVRDFYFYKMHLKPYTVMRVLLVLPVAAGIYYLSPYKGNWKPLCIYVTSFTTCIVVDFIAYSVMLKYYEKYFKVQLDQLTTEIKTFLGDNSDVSKLARKVQKGSMTRSRIPKNKITENDNDIFQNVSGGILFKDGNLKFYAEAEEYNNRTKLLKSLCTKEMLLMGERHLLEGGKMEEFAAGSFVSDAADNECRILIDSGSYIEPSSGFFIDRGHTYYLVEDCRTVDGIIRRKQQRLSLMRDENQLLSDHKHEKPKHANTFVDGHANLNPGSSNIDDVD